MNFLSNLFTKPFNCVFFFVLTTLIGARTSSSRFCIKSLQAIYGLSKLLNQEKRNKKLSLCVYCRYRNIDYTCVRNVFWCIYQNKFNKIRVEGFYVVLVGHFITCLKLQVEQQPEYFLLFGERSMQTFLVSFGLSRT